MSVISNVKIFDGVNERLTMGCSIFTKDGRICEVQIGRLTRLMGMSLMAAGGS